MKKGYVMIFARVDERGKPGARWSRYAECEEDELIGEKESEIMEMEHRTGVAWECVMIKELKENQEGQVKL